MFDCIECKKTFKTKKDMQYHISNRVCIKQLENSQNKCKFCNKHYSNKSSVYWHQKLCKSKNNTSDNETNNTINDLKKKIDELTNKVNTLQNINNGTINNGTINNINNNITINIVKHGSEEDNLTSDEKLFILKSGINAVVKMIEQVHFNKNRKENHNIYISNMRDKHCNIYDGKKWIIDNKDTIIDNLYQHKKEYIDDILDEYKSLLSSHHINSLKKILESDDDNFKIKQLKDRIMLLLYNSRDIVLETKNNNKK